MVDALNKIIAVGKLLEKKSYGEITMQICDYIYMIYSGYPVMAPDDDEFIIDSGAIAGAIVPPRVSLEDYIYNTELTSRMMESITVEADDGALTFDLNAVKFSTLEEEIGQGWLQYSHALIISGPPVFRKLKCGNKNLHYIMAGEHYIMAEEYSRWGEVICNYSETCGMARAELKLTYDGYWLEFLNSWTERALLLSNNSNYFQRCTARVRKWYDVLYRRD